MTVAPPVPNVDVDELRGEIQKEYASVAENPDKGFHFHTGRKLAGLLGYDESLPVEDGWADVIISNGVVNLAPDKVGLFREMNRALKPGGRLQIGDIMVQKAVPDGAKQNIDLWKG